MFNLYKISIIKKMAEYFLDIYTPIQPMFGTFLDLLFR